MKVFVVHLYGGFKDVSLEVVVIAQGELVGNLWFQKSITEFPHIGRSDGRRIGDEVDKLVHFVVAQLHRTGLIEGVAERCARRKSIVTLDDLVFGIVCLPNGRSIGDRATFFVATDGTCAKVLVEVVAKSVGKPNFFTKLQLVLEVGGHLSTKLILHLFGEQVCLGASGYELSWLDTYLLKFRSCRDGLGRT